MPCRTSTNIKRSLHHLSDHKSRTGTHTNAASSVLGAYATRNRGISRYFRFLIDGLAAMNNNPAESNTWVAERMERPISVTPAASYHCVNSNHQTTASGSAVSKSTSE